MQFELHETMGASIIAVYNPENNSKNTWHNLWLSSYDYWDQI